MSVPHIVWEQHSLCQYRTSSGSSIAYVSTGHRLHSLWHYRTSHSTHLQSRRGARPQRLGTVSLVGAYARSVPGFAQRRRRHDSTIRWVSTGHRLAPYARSVPDTA
eukprot:3941782-Rhodomonas_salina.1